MCALRRDLSRLSLKEMAGERAAVLQQSDDLRSLFPQWQTTFVAGQLLSHPGVWNNVFSEFNERVPSWLSKWLVEGYSVRLDKESFGR